MPSTRIVRASISLAVLAATLGVAPQAAGALVIAPGIGDGAPGEEAAVTPAAAGDPFGAFDAVKIGSPLRMTAVGWAIDPNTAAPITVRITVDGTLYRRVVADRSRVDVGKVYPVAGPLHGFEVSLDALTAGKHRVCVVAENTGAGTNSELGCKNVYKFTGSSDPRGSVDSATQDGPGKLTVSGWTVDPDSTAKTAVHVYVNGRFAVSADANLERADVGREFPGYGRNHGYRSTLAAHAGVHQVCVYAINVGAGTTNPLLGCRSVTVRSGNPVGNFEGIDPGGAIAVVGGPRPGYYAVGWALDHDTVASIDVHMYVDDKWAGSHQAARTRPDVGRAHPGYGNNHGFEIALDWLTPGTHKVCIYAINKGAGTTNPLLGCRSVTV
jgi:hypothetical protein